MRTSIYTSHIQNGHRSSCNQAEISLLVPYHLFDAIVDCLHRDFATLQSVSTVSSTFRSLAQRKIFYEVSLSIPSSTEQPNSGSAEVLLEHLAESPHLVDYVRRLNITDDGYTREMNAFTMQGDDAFIHILSSFKYLSAIIFRRRSNGVSKIIWTNLPLNMQTAILESLRCLTVVRVEILDTIEDFHLQLLVDSHALEHLRVFDLDWPRVPPSKTSPPVQKMALKSLELRETTPFSGGKIFRFMCDPESVDLSQLTSLRVEMDPMWPSLIKETDAFLRKVSDSLKCLHYFRPRYARRHNFDSSSTLDLSIPSHLKCFRISTNLANNGFPWLIKCLGRIPPCSRINTIKLHLNLDMHVPSYTGDIDWAVLDTLICTLHNLRSCHIYIRTTTRSILRLLGGLLPSAQSKGILRITIWICTATQQSLFF
ncbi:uncharacterized protein LACBIDRAFT_309376 [Laccaria bicolor S238N-H82]|uniref:Predicted protein n=1 Tax=Laccaria bicolor (strain S238N-H82 / ATCC MYA-4686) TaxID=486041 RepID=B0DS64_LACBS|nr:uncharacterized protein LACBIDRAFT_309376 [Laccaria bicolor S238N-H82]EDR02494.1 predicted protein [Laccaria bicolor S238N-H82]|eukprot:XP_001886857.1 predicted protein [Laccaria bicolor S238N-H82]